MPRREFLYDIKAWEARRIIRGYKRRNILQYQLQRIQAWASMFCMGNPKKVGPNDIVHLYFDDYEDEEPPAVDEDVVNELQAEMAAINKKLKRKKKK